jgi:hypothetical protein
MPLKSPIAATMAILKLLKPIDLVNRAVTAT